MNSRTRMCLVVVPILLGVILYGAGAVYPAGAAFGLAAITGDASGPAGTGRLSDARPEIAPGVLETVELTGEAQVLITLKDPVRLDAQGPDRAPAVARAQADVLSALPADEFTLSRRYTYVPGLAGTVTAEGLARLQAHPAVAAVQLDEKTEGHLGESVAALGADVVHRDYGWTGRGVTVAVLDTGVDSDHPDLSDDIIGQVCFTHGTCPPHRTNYSTSAEDQNGHGTNVTSVITSRGVVSSVGFAPDADIVAVRILGADNSGYVSDWVAGLDWVRANRDTYNIRVVNMSIGTFALYPAICDAEQSLAANAIAQLVAQGVILFASSGNQGSTTSISSPACNRGVVAVGATYDGYVGRQPNWGTYNRFGSSWPNCYDASTSLLTVTCFTNSSSILDVVAPGAAITAAGLGGGRSTYWGTSQASPTAAGIAALMLQANGDLRPAEIERIMKKTGTIVTDPKNGRQFSAINALNAVRAADGFPSRFLLDGPATGVAGLRSVFAAYVGRERAAQPVRYQWLATGQAPVMREGVLADAAGYTWSAPGVYRVWVEASNEYGSVTAERTITILPGHQIFLPVMSVR